MQHDPIPPRLSAPDELAFIRAQKRRLEARERELKAGFLAGRLETRGTWDSVVLKPHRRRLFCPDRLPPEIRADPRYWQVIESVAVVLQKTGTAGVTVPRPSGRER